MTHRIPQDGGDWMRDIERRLRHAERRPAVAAASDILGPSIGPAAKQIIDWQASESLFNGWVWSDLGSLNSPDGSKVWIGMVISTNVGHGLQQAWSHPPGTTTAPLRYIRTFHRHLGESTVFSAWTVV